MRKPRVIFIGLKDYHTVWSVDDAWFEGTNIDEREEIGGDSIIGGLLELKGNRERLSFTEIKNRIEELEKALNEDGLADQLWYNTGDVYCFRYLIDTCEKHDTSLAFCNFEYLENNFRDINKASSALLLDVHYTRHSDSDLYGVHLLKRLLERKRFRGDVFFWTQWKKLVDDTTDYNIVECDWWPLKYIPIVPKMTGATMDLSRFIASLDAFLTYFRSRFQDNVAWRKLAESLEEACNYGDYNNGHINSLDEITDVLFPLLDSYQKTNNPQRSFTALYYANPERPGEVDRKVDSKVLKDLFEYAGYPLHCDNNIEVFLPIMPGMIFILNLFDFIKSMGGATILGDKSIKLEVSRDEHHESYRILIPVPDVLQFEAAYHTRSNGQACRALRAVNSCNPARFVQENIMGNGQERAITWGLVDPDDRDHPPTIKVKPSFDNDEHAIVLSWRHRV